MKPLNMNCRAGCGACCIAPSITSAIPGMPHGKPAGVPCIHLDKGKLCRLFNKPERPDVCQQFKFSLDSCGENFDDAMQRLTRLELLTN